MKTNYSTLIITSMLTLLFVNTSYADDADTHCKQMVGVEWKAVREQPQFTQSGSVGCDALPTQVIRDMNKMCNKNVPTTMMPNCSVTYYSDVPADTVVECSAIPVQGQKSTVIFKYALCQKNNKQEGYYAWALLIKNIDQKYFIPNSIWQKK